MYLEINACEKWGVATHFQPPLCVCCMSWHYNEKQNVTLNTSAKLLQALRHSPVLGLPPVPNRPLGSPTATSIEGAESPQPDRPHDRSDLANP